MNTYKRHLPMIAVLLVMALAAFPAAVYAGEGLPFADVREGWSYDAIEYVFENGYMQGNSEGMFCPKEPLTRAMAVTVLYRLDSAPEVEYGEIYGDVADGRYYSKAAVWAYENGIVNGTHSGESGEPYFSPDRNITRQELVTIFLRYAEYKNINIPRSPAADSFSDYGELSTWAVRGINWAVDTGLIRGTGDGTTLSPAGEATREQFAAIVQRFMCGEYVYLPEHVFYDNMGKGVCEVMTGDVLVLTVFVGDGESVWSDEETERVKAKQAEEIAGLEASAEGYGVSLDVTAIYDAVSVPEVLERDDYVTWTSDILEKIGLVSLQQFDEVLTERYGCDSAAVMFYFNKAERSFAAPSRFARTSEFTVIYGADSDAFTHELCHLFGARDLYYPEAITQAAKETLGESVMLDSRGRVIDSLTAYLIGWTPTPEPAALAFLSATSYITKEQYDAEREKETFTGYVESHAGNGYVYTGYMKDGLFCGEGTLTWDSGSVYVGEFEYNNMNGYGVFTSVNGFVYEGEWKDGKMHGVGKLTYQSGRVVIGRWQSGNFVG